MTPRRTGTDGFFVSVLTAKQPESLDHASARVPGNRALRSSLAAKRRGWPGQGRR